ncbi:hypothetical protein DFH06DRAFT_1322650 [Mycena polygramma]|nr:hypothetical protein DFH06DRAFT_1322650 [Mycena polygramma]
MRSAAHPSWINAEMVAHINIPTSDQLLANSIAQNVLIYNSANLQLFAADWRYQIVGKMKRALDYKDWKDISDAVDILHELNAGSGGTQRLALMKEWYEYGAMLTTEHLDFINKAYRKKYGTLGIAE